MKAPRSIATHGASTTAALYGQWIDLTGFSDFDEFYNYCCALHTDEQDPELMFQDYENFPEAYYDECLSRNEFNKIQEYTEMCDSHKKEAVDAYISLYGDDCLQDFDERYQGEWDSEEAFGEYLFDECYCDSLRCLPSNIRGYIDYAAFSRDIFACDYDFEDGYVFRS